jgi:hypothetical protein
LRFKRNRAQGCGRRRVHCGWAVLLALVGALAFAPAALAVESEPLLLEVNPEAIDGSGYGEVVCEYSEGGKKKEIKECVELEFEGISQKTVTLKAVPELGSEFVRFENGTGSASICNGTTKPSCEVTLKENSYVEVRFDEITPALTVNVTGEGEVSCLVEGLLESCPEVKEEYGFDTEITLEPEPGKGWEFAGFKGGIGSASVCSGVTSSCSFLLEKDSTIEAVFEPIMYALKITKAGTGQGTVTCNGTTCSSYPDGAEVTLKATPASGSTFAGWSGEGCSGTGACLVIIEAASATVTATFQASTPPPPPPPPTLEPEGTAKAGAIAKVKAGKAQVKLSCAGGPCNGALKLTAKLLQGGKRKTLTIGRASFSLAEGAATTLKVKLSASAVRELAKSHSLKARAGGSDVVAGPVKLKLAAGG